ncbi:DUF4113 domain-containing protein [Rapidithrix thailandica]
MKSVDYLSAKMGRKAIQLACSAIKQPFKMWKSPCYITNMGDVF